MGQATACRGKKRVRGKGPTTDSPEGEGELAILEKRLAVWRRDWERSAAEREAAGTDPSTCGLRASSCAIVTNLHTAG